MPLRTAEAFILRTYPLKESDKIVSFFTREYGKRRGVARAASRPKSRFGSSLEPLSQVRIQYFEREGKDLSNLDHCELLSSMVASSGADLVHSVAVSLMVEVADRVLPDHEVSDPVYRLFLAVLPLLRREGPEAVWLPLTYYLYWMVRLGGYLPNFTANDLGPEALGLAQALSQQPAAALAADVRAQGRGGRELRQALKAALEDHLESGLQAWPILADLET
ncbi:MAG TPA: DNA repair protein RecO [Terriglobales bacterium]|nr:DNA repair protein RecO [Terriglobales bacterium]